MVPSQGNLFERLDDPVIPRDVGAHAHHRLLRSAHDADSAPAHVLAGAVLDCAVSPLHAGAAAIRLSPTGRVKEMLLPRFVADPWLEGDRPLIATLGRSRRR